jgi:LmbE family N-acetylglucosaminyl deacetylase
MSANWPLEPELVPYDARAVLPLRHLLVLAPHPDDEVLGCGGLIASTLQAGAAVTVVVASDGAQAGDAAVRQAESRAAAVVLAAGGQGPQLRFWGLPDRGLLDHTGLVPRLQHLLSSCGADGVLLPSPFEVHPDHRALSLATLQAARSTAVVAEFWCYEVGQPLLADVLIDITPVLSLKRAALRCFASQMAVQAYDEQMLGLNRYRAYTLGPSVSHAEAFQRVPAAALAGGLDAVLDSIDTRLRSRFGAGTPRRR